MAELTNGNKGLTLPQGSVIAVITLLLGFGGGIVTMSMRAGSMESSLREHDRRIDAHEHLAYHSGVPILIQGFEGRLSRLEAEVINLRREIERLTNAIERRNP